MRWVILVVLCSCGLGVADDLPENPGEIKTLTVEQAEGLVERIEQAEGVLERKKVYSLRLTGLRTVTPEVAAKLAQYNGDLNLGGLSEITPQAAAEFAKHEGRLSLGGLTQLTPQVASELAKHHGALSLRGLSELTPQVAFELAKHNNLLSLGLTKMSAEIAAALASHKGLLFLPQLTSLSSDEADAIAGHQGSYLFLQNLTELKSVLLAERLARNPPHFPEKTGVDSPRESFLKRIMDRVLARLSLGGLVTLTVQEAKALAAYEGTTLDLSGLHEILPAVAEALGKRRCGVVLGVQVLTPNIAELLSENSQDIEFAALETLSPEAAGALSRHNGVIRFHRLAEISTDVVWRLTQGKGKFSFPRELRINSMRSTSADDSHDGDSQRRQQSASEKIVGKWQIKRSTDQTDTGGPSPDFASLQFTKSLRILRYADPLFEKEIDSTFYEVVKRDEAPAALRVVYSQPYQSTLSEDELQIHFSEDADQLMINDLAFSRVSDAEILKERLEERLKGKWVCKRYFGLSSEVADGTRSYTLLFTGNEMQISAFDKTFTTQYMMADGATLLTDCDKDGNIERFKIAGISEDKMVVNGGFVAGAGDFFLFRRESAR